MPCSGNVGRVILQKVGIAGGGGGPHPHAPDFHREPIYLSINAPMVISCTTIDILMYHSLEIDIN